MGQTRSILFLLSLCLCNSLAAQFAAAEEVYRMDMVGMGNGAVLLPNPAGGDDVLILDGYKLLLYRNGSAPGIPVEDCLNSLRVISVTVGDIDGDGFEDIVVFHVSPSQNLLPKEITWYRNLGDATFSTGTLLLSGDFPNPRIAIHDVDGDGSKDIVVGLSESGGNPGSISWFPQLSDGTFGQKEVLLEDMGYRFAIADLDGDGDLDMVVAAYGNPQSTLRTLYRENDGSYTIESERMVGGSVIGLWLKDLDLDGTLDLYLGGGGLRMMRNDENGGWEDPEVIIPSTTKQGLADVNGDGLLDVWGLVGGADESKALKYRLADSTGGLQETMSRYMGWLSFSPVWTDLTGDGINDLVYGSDVSFYEVGYFPGDSIGGYDEYRRMTRSMRDVGQMLVLDIDGDGDKDIIVLSKQDYKVSWLEEQGNGNWLEHVIWQSNVHLQYGGPVNDEVPLELVAMDADGNGTMDLLMVRANTPPEGAPSAIFHGTKWLLNDGNGVFTYSTSLQGYPTAQGSFWARPKAMDFDQDGVLDILAFRDHIWFWRGVAGGGFEAPVILDAGGGQSFLFFDGMMGDVDGDGDLDIVAPGGYPPTYHERLTFMECTGPAVFSELQDITAGQGFTGTMQFWDIDEDGDLDVYASRKYGAESVWLENIGGDFEVRHELGPYVNGRLADFDLDGDLDMATNMVDSNGTRFVLLANAGAGQLLTPSIIHPEVVRSFVAEDMDGDGYPDLVISHDPHTISMYRNLGEWLTTSIEDNKVLPKAKVYPNPATMWVRVEVPNGQTKRWGLFDSMGRFISEGMDLNGGVHEFSRRGLASGLYFLRTLDGSILNKAAYPVVFE